MINKRPIISVIGSHRQSWEPLAVPLGQEIAKRGYHLLTGAGGGVMRAVAKGFTSVTDRKGLCLGIVPIEDYHHTDIQEPQNEFVEVPIVMVMNPKALALKMPYSYNRINILTSHAVIALPGGQGTKREVSSALIRHKPLILYGHKEDFKDFPEAPYIASTLTEINNFLDKYIKPQL